MTTGINFPQITSPIGTVRKLPSGQMVCMLDQAWFQLLLQLFVRTGASQGGITDGQLSEGQFTSQIEYLEQQTEDIEPNVPQTIDYQQAIQDAALANPSVLPLSSIQGFDESAVVLSITGTTHQIIASSPTGNVTLSTPQDIDTSSTPRFARMGLGEAAQSDALLGFAAGSTTIAPVKFTSGTNLTSPTAGAAEYDGSRYWVTLDSTSRAIISRTLFSQTQSVTVANTVTETLIIGTGIGSVTLPANYGVAGKSLYIQAWGYHSAVSNPIVQVRVYKGSTLLLDTGAISSGNSTNAQIRIEALITWYSTTSVWAEGFYKEEGGGASASSFPMVNTAAVTVNTDSEDIKITFTWGTASASNTITVPLLSIAEAS